MRKTAYSRSLRGKACTTCEHHVLRLDLAFRARPPHPGRTKSREPSLLLSFWPVALLQLQLRKQGGSLYSPRCPTSRTCERCGKQLTAGVLEGKLVQHEHIRRASGLVLRASPIKSCLWGLLPTSPVEQPSGFWFSVPFRILRPTQQF